MSQSERKFRVNVRIKGSNQFGNYRYRGERKPSIGDKVTVENSSGETREVHVTGLHPPDADPLIRAEASAD